MQLSVKIISTLLLVNFVAFSTCQSLEDSDDAVVLMTTVEPIDGEGSVSFKNASTNIGVEGNGSCMNVSDCSTCKTQGCNWVKCEGAVEGAHCTDTMAEACSPVPCDTDPCSNFTLCEDCVASSPNCSWLNCGDSSVSFCSSSSLAGECQQVDCHAANLTTIAPGPDNTTTTTATPDTNTTTTEPPTTTTVITTTTVPDTTTTTDSPNDTTTTTEEPATTTAVPTTVPTTAPTTSAPPPAPATGGFSAGSFFGGITLTLALLAVGYGGFKFYKTRYDVNYRTL